MVQLCRFLVFAYLPFSRVVPLSVPLFCHGVTIEGVDVVDVVWGLG
jgi:hypothetical protein